MNTGYQEPNYTQTPNALFDKHMADMTEAELKVTLALIRKTFGWHKEEDVISFSQFMELTGLARNSVNQGIQAGIERGTISRRKVGTSYAYTLVVQNSDQFKIKTATGSKSEPKLVQNLNTQKKGKKGKKEDSVDKPQIAVDEKPRDMLFDAIASGVFGLSLKHIGRQGGRIGKVKKVLTDKHTSLDDVEIVKLLQAFTDWYQDEYDGISLPRDATKFDEHYSRFLSEQDRNHEVRVPTEMELKEMAWLQE